MQSHGYDQQKKRNFWQRIHIDLPLLLCILALMVLGLFVVYSSGGQEMAIVYRQITRLGIALLVMFTVHKSHLSFIKNGQSQFLLWVYYF